MQKTTNRCRRNKKKQKIAQIEKVTKEMGWKEKASGKEPRSQEKNILDNFTNILEEFENEGLFSVTSPKSSKDKNTKEVLETSLL